MAFLPFFRNLAAIRKITFKAIPFTPNLVKFFLVLFASTIMASGANSELSSSASSTLPASLPLPVLTAAFVLIPSQIPGARHKMGARKKKSNKGTKSKPRKPIAASRLVSVLNANDKDGHDNPFLDKDDDSTAGDDVVFIPETPHQDSTTVAESSSPPVAVETKKIQRFRIHRPRTGNLPDVNWRAIPLSHLRCHPNFQPLPPPSMINFLPTKEHVRYFRQDSWQWDYLHQGRCTTSQAAAALGFLEPKTAEILGIPPTLRRGGVGAWERLREGMDDLSLEEMERILCEGRSLISTETIVNKWRPGAKESDKVWISSQKLRRNSNSSNNVSVSFPFMARYKPKITYEELFRRKKMLMKHQPREASPIMARMQWGNCQEATSILTALNYFCSVDNRTIIHEVGMCGAGFDDEICNEGESSLNGLKIGASPDAIICHGNNTVEVLEVKNHCPFVRYNHNPNFNIQRRHGKNNKKKKQKHHANHNNQSHRNEMNQSVEHDPTPKHYTIRDFQLERKIPTAYIPQLMMEMLCVGEAVDLDSSVTDAKSTPICTSAVMVRQTATKGAILLRLHRDESWIQEMKYWLGLFKTKYVDTGMIPPDNFFLESDANEKSRYKKFLKRTKELSESVEQVAYIENGRIQRAVSENGIGGDLPLFLDSVEETNQ